MKIFFDFDGTLVDVAPRHYAVYCKVVEQFHGSPLTFNKYWSLKRQKINWGVILEASNLEYSIKELFLEEFKKKIESPDYLVMDKLFSGVKGLLNNLVSNHQCYLVSLRRKPENLLVEVEALGLAKFFTKIIVGHSDEDGHDIKVSLISQELGKGNGVIIGDTEADVLTGKKLGLITVAVLSGIRDDDFLASLKPDYISKDIKEIINKGLFKKINHRLL